MTLIIEYDPILGDYEPDGLVRQYVNSLIYSYENEKFLYRGETLHRVVANEAMIMAIRLAIRRKQIDHEKVIFRYKDIDIKPHSNGRLPNWPVGFCSLYDGLLSDFIMEDL